MGFYASFLSCGAFWSGTTVLWWRFKNVVIVVINNMKTANSIKETTQIQSWSVDHLHALFDWELKFPAYLIILCSALLMLCCGACCCCCPLYCLLLMKFCSPTTSPAYSVGSVSMILFGVLYFPVIWHLLKKLLRGHMAIVATVRNEGCCEICP